MLCAAPIGPRKSYTPTPLTPDSMPSDFAPPSHQAPSAMDDLISHQQSQHQSRHHPQPLPSPSTPTGNVLQATWTGMVMTTLDALRIIEACLTGELMHTARRPHDRERDHLIKSGNVFVYEETSSGIKRWTDGQNWSPSRILGNYLIYRELDKNFPPGDKKRAIKRKRDGKPEIQNGAHPAPGGPPNSMTDERDRAYLGSLVDSYPFKEGGLIKKTISIKWNNVMHHLVSYYSLEDARARRLMYPSDDPKLMHVRPRPEMIRLQDFRVPVEQEDPQFLDERAIMLGMIQPGSYAPTPSLERTMSLPQMPNSLIHSYGGHFQMALPVHNPLGSGMQLSNHYAHPPSSFMTWDRPRAPSLQIPPFGPNLSHMIDGGPKRRRSEAYEQATPDGSDLFSPPASHHSHELSRGDHHYFQSSSSSYTIPSLPAVTTVTEPSQSSMAPPPVTTVHESTSTSLSYAPSMSSSASSAAMDFPSVTSVAQPPVSSMQSVDPPMDYSSLTSMPSLTASSLDGSSRGDHFFSSFSTPNWSTSSHDSGSYLSGSGRALNGWHNNPPAGGHH